MSKVLLFVLVALMAVSLIVASTSDNCGRHGDTCTSDGQCCSGTKCHAYAKRCQVQITSEELMRQREKVLGRKGKDY